MYTCTPKHTIHNDSELYSNAQYNNNTQTQSGQGNKSSNITVRIDEKQTNPRNIGTKVKLKMFELLKCKYTNIHSYSVYT